VQEAIAAANQRLRTLAAPGVQVFDSAAVLAGADGYVRPAYAEDELHSAWRVTRRSTQPWGRC
jgi:hypothetical protein